MKRANLMPLAIVLGCLGVLCCVLRGCASVRADAGRNEASHERTSDPGTVEKITLEIYGREPTPAELMALPKFDKVTR